MAPNIKTHMFMSTPHKCIPTHMQKRCLSLIFIIAIKHTNERQLGEERVCFRLQLIVHHERKSGQNLKAETLLTGLSFMACSACFLRQPGPSAWDGPTHNGFVPPTLIINQVMSHRHKLI